MYEYVYMLFQILYVIIQYKHFYKWKLNFFIYLFYIPQKNTRNNIIIIMSTKSQLKSALKPMIVENRKFLQTKIIFTENRWFPFCITFSQKNGYQALDQCGVHLLWLIPVQQKFRHT